MRNRRESGWLKVLAACWVVAMLSVAGRILVFPSSGEETAGPETGPAVAAKPHCATRQMRMSCFRDDPES